MNGTLRLTMLVLGMLGYVRGGKKEVLAGPALVQGGDHVLAEPILLCERGGKLEKKGCALVEYAMGDLSCPKGSLFRNGRCYRTDFEDPVRQCSAGYDLLDGRCQSTELMPVLPYCEKGYHLGMDSTTCAREIKKEENIRCPENYTERSGLCVHTILAEPGVTCPNGGVLDTSQGKKPLCMRTREEGIELSCPKEFAYVDGLCVRETLSKPLKDKCPGKKNKDGECVVREVEPIKKHCKNRTSMEGSECTFEVDVPALTSCDKGFHLAGGQCQRIQRNPIQYICNGKQTKKGLQCTDLEVKEALVTCPEHTVFVDGACWETLQTDVELKCENGGKKGAYDRAGLGSTVGENECLTYDIKAPKTRCDKIARLVDGVCVSEIMEKPSLTCPANSLKKDKKCTMTELEDPRLTCKKGALLEDGVCISRAKGGAQKSQCAKDFKYTNGRCERLFKYKPTILCHGIGAKSNKGVCDGTVAVKPSLVCPKNFVMDITGQCIQSHILEPRLACPAGYKIKDNMCIEKGKK